MLVSTSLKVASMLLAAFIVGEDGVGVEAKHVVEPGKSIQCGAQDGCAIMSKREFVQLTQDVYEMGEKAAKSVCKREI